MLLESRTFTSNIVCMHVLIKRPLAISTMPIIPTMHMYAFFKYLPQSLEENKKLYLKQMEERRLRRLEQKEASAAIS